MMKEEKKKKRARSSWNECQLAGVHGKPYICICLTK
jgi:hypothetical protein